MEDKIVFVSCSYYYDYYGGEGLECWNSRFWVTGAERRVEMQSLSFSNLSTCKCFIWSNLPSLAGCCTLHKPDRLEMLFSRNSHKVTNGLSVQQ